MAAEKRAKRQAERLASQSARALTPFVVEALRDPDFLEAVKVRSFVGLARFEIDGQSLGICKLPREPDVAFTPREGEVAKMLGEGKTEVAIAGELNLSVSRVTKITAQIKRKWNAETMLEVALNARILNAFLDK